MRRKTTKPQITGEIWHDKKYQQAAVRGLGTSKDDYPSFNLFGMSTVVVLLGLGFAFVSSMLNPSPEQGADNAILATQDGGLYVRYEDKLHPVTNMASARLITGNPDKASVVKADSLTSMPRGPLMGIPSAPTTLDTFDDTSASWGVCTYQSPGSSLSLTEQSSLRTTLVAGRDTWTKADTLDNGGAVVVAPAGNQEQRWLLFNNRRAQLNPEDNTVLTALGIDRDTMTSPTIVSDALLNAIDILPVLTAPELAQSGQPSDTVPGHNIGDVLVATSAAGNQTFYAVTNNGVQRVPELVADLLLGKGGARTTVDNPADATQYPTDNTIELSNYPATSPKLRTPASLCYSWSRPAGGDKAATHIVTADAIPVNSAASKNVQELLPNRRGSSTADYYATGGGKGWFVQLTGGGETNPQQGQLAFISDTGVLYPLVPDEKYSYDDVAQALGLSDTTPLPMPDSIAKLFPRGADLSVRAALVEHIDIPVDINDGSSTTPTTTSSRPQTSAPRPTREPAQTDQQGSPEPEPSEEQPTETDTEQPTETDTEQPTEQQP